MSADSLNESDIDVSDAADRLSDLLDCNPPVLDAEIAADLRVVLRALTAPPSRDVRALVEEALRGRVFGVVNVLRHFNGPVQTAIREMSGSDLDELREKLARALTAKEPARG